VRHNVASEYKKLPIKGRSTRPCPLTPEQGEKGRIIILFIIINLGLNAGKIKIHGLSGT
jgi:hypothetical protein